MARVEPLSGYKDKTVKEKEYKLQVISLNYHNYIM